MAIGTETTPKDAAKLAEKTKLPGETPQATAAYARMLVDESASRTRTGTETIMNKANQATSTIFKAAEEAASFGRGNAEALTEATKTYVAGMQELSRQSVALVQGLAEHAMESAKALSAARNLKDAATIQAGLARTAFERTITGSTKLQETALKVAEQSIAPLTARMTLAVEKVGRPIAA